MPWSYSWLKNAETCLKRFYHYNVAKDVKEPETQQLRDGFALHAVFDERIKGKPLGLGYTQYEPLLARIINAPGETHGEKKLALTAEFKPVAFFGKGVWFRTVIDAIKINGSMASIFDWKDGRPKEDLTQLQLMAATTFHHMPSIQRVKAGLVFVNHDEVKPAEFVREDLPEIWSEILPRVRAVEKAIDTQEFPPKPSGLCKNYCSVISCPFHGKGSR